MFKGNFNWTTFIKARLAQLVEHRVTNLKVAGLSPTVSKIFISLYFVAFDALLAGRLAPYNQV